MKLLLIGDAFSQYTIAFSSFLKQHDPSVKIDIINTRLVDSNTGYNDIFRNVYDMVYKNGFINNIILRIPKVRGVVNRIIQKRIVKEVNKVIDKYDVICLQGFWKNNLLVYNGLNASNIFTVGAVWGSDFYRRDGLNNIQMLFNAFDRCDRVFVSTDEMINDIRMVYNLPKEKIRKCVFGLEPLEALVKMEKVSSIGSKLKSNFEGDSFVITCGHNASSFQEHYAIIEQLLKIRSSLPSSYLLVFPVTYGGTQDYILSIKNKLVESGLKFVMIEDYLTDEKVALLRLATDIFIQVQKTDAFSGSMREHLFAKNVVLTGEWLPYQALVNDGIYFETISNLDKIGENIVNIIENYQEYKRKVILQNTPDKFERFRWPISIKEWHRTFMEYKSVKHD